MNLESYIRDIPDFPKKGILFKDISPVLASPDAFRYTIDKLADAFRDAGATKILGAEARGFIFGATMAYKMGIPFVPVRKPGKLPYKTVQVSYELEYGTDTLCMHEDAVEPGDRVLIIDDLLATGGTVRAIMELVRNQGAEVVGIGFLIELTFFKARATFGEVPVVSLIECFMEE